MESSVIDIIFRNEEAINREVKKNREYIEASARSLKIYDKLCQTLTDEQKDDFEKFIENEVDQSSIMIETAFKFGVKYGVRIMAESMLD